MGQHARMALVTAYSRQQACEQWRLLLEGLMSSASAAPADQTSGKIAL